MRRTHSNSRDWVRVNEGDERVGRRCFLGRAMRNLGLFSVLTMAAVAFSQNASDHPSTDSAKINDALRAWPASITKNATILDWRQQRGAEYRVFHKGTNEWTVLLVLP